VVILSKERSGIVATALLDAYHDHLEVTKLTQHNDPHHNFVRECKYIIEQIKTLQVKLERAERRIEVLIDLVGFRSPDYIS